MPFADVGDVSEIPCNEIIDLVKRRQRDVKSVRQKFSMKNAAGDISLGKDRGLFRKFEAFERFDYFQIARPVRFVHAFQFPLNQN